MNEPFLTTAYSCLGLKTFIVKTLKRFQRICKFSRCIKNVMAGVNCSPELVWSQKYENNKITSKKTSGLNRDL